MFQKKLLLSALALVAVAWTPASVLAQDSLVRNSEFDDAEVQDAFKGWAFADHGNYGVVWEIAPDNDSGDARAVIRLQSKVSPYVCWRQNVRLTEGADLPKTIAARHRNPSAHAILFLTFHRTNPQGSDSLGVWSAELPATSEFDDFKSPIKVPDGTNMIQIELRAVEPGDFYFDRVDLQ